MLMNSNLRCNNALALLVLTLSKVAHAQDLTKFSADLASYYTALLANSDFVSVIGELATKSPDVISSLVALQTRTDLGVITAPPAIFTQLSPPYNSVLLSVYNDELSIASRDGIILNGKVMTDDPSSSEPSPTPSAAPSPTSLPSATTRLSQRTTSAPTSTDSASPGSTSAQSAQASASSAPAAGASGSRGGTPPSTTIGLGVGLGLGIPLAAALGALVTVLLLRRRPRRREAEDHRPGVDYGHDPTVGVYRGGETRAGTIRSEKP